MPDAQTLVDQLQHVLGISVMNGSITLHVSDNGLLQKVKTESTISLQAQKRLETLKRPVHT